MSEIKIATNHRPRPVLYWADLTDKERAEFDHIDEDAREWATFARYKGDIYDLSKFCPVSTDELWSRGWQIARSDSFFSGIIARYPDDDLNSVVLGLYSI